MEIGITWENKLVYNKEIKINKKAVKTGLVIAGVGFVGVALAMILIPPTATFAFTTSGVGSFTATDIGSTAYDVAKMTNKNGKLINDTILNTAQAKDIKSVFDLLFKGYDMSNTLAYEGVPAFAKEASNAISGVTSQLTPQNARAILDSLIERKATYSQGEVDLIKTLIDCITN